MKKFYALPAALLFVVILFISGCGKNDCTECCDTAAAGTALMPISDTEIDHPYFQFTGSINPQYYYYFYVAGTPQKVQFFVADTKNDICTDEHLNIEYQIQTTAAVQSRPMKVFGEVYWSAFSDDIVLTTDANSLSHVYTSELNNVGLKQAFPEGAAEVDFYLTVEFESLGSLDADKQYFKDHVNYLHIVCSYKKF